uniref:Uncharacterized protein n=1 Tax=Oryza sativa subsp. japonica TaxID=39947 RepID=Q6YUQ3_ORYSJ|nr:hypothetical protein [Oryza sativa Japonica Group]
MPPLLRPQAVLACRANPPPRSPAARPSPLRPLCCRPQWQLQERIVGWSYLASQIVTMLQNQVKYVKYSGNII